MTPENPDELTFDGLQKFLLRVGFAQPATVNRSLAFHHPETGTLLVLSIPDDGRSIRPADMLSVLTRLESVELVSDTELHRLQSGRLPLAS